MKSIFKHFIYRVGEMAVAKEFNSDRWEESTSEIHFYLTQEEAIGHL